MEQGNRTPKRPTYENLASLGQDDDDEY
jgi:DNA-directed RNA polymerase subunit beta